MKSKGLLALLRSLLFALVSGCLLGILGGGVLFGGRLFLGRRCSLFLLDLQLINDGLQLVLRVPAVVAALVFFDLGVAQLDAGGGGLDVECFSQVFDAELGGGCGGLRFLGRLFGFLLCHDASPCV